MPRVNIFIRFPNLDAFASPGMTVQVLNLDGRVMIQSTSRTYLDRPMLGIMILAMASPFSGRRWMTRSGGSKNAFLSVPWFFPAT